MRVFGFAGWSGSGKTTLIEQLIPRLVARGLRVSLVKHAHLGFEIDHPGKDSFRHRVAGCTEVLVTSPRRWALVHELRGEPELSMAGTLGRLSPCDRARAFPSSRSTGLGSASPGSTRTTRTSSRSPPTCPPGRRPAGARISRWTDTTRSQRSSPRTHASHVPRIDDARAGGVA